MILETHVKMPKIVRARKSSTKFIKVFVSCTHASITACWTLYCFFTDDDMLSDMINHSTVSTYLLICFSGGYFFHDTLRILRITKYPIKLDDAVTLLHHIVVEVCLCCIIISHRYVKAAAVGLLVEVNTFFLHVRTLLQMLGYSKQSCVYKVNGMLNLISLLVFRVCLFCLLFRWAVMNFYAGEQPEHAVITITFALILLVSMAIFGQVLVNDDWIKFLPGSKTPYDDKSS